MSVLALRRATGYAGVIGAVLIIVELPLYFVYAGPPPDWNVLTRSLFGLAGMTMLIVFMTGLRHWIKQAAPDYEWIGAVAGTAGLMWLTVAFISTGLETGAVIQAAEPIDPTITVSGTYVLYGSVSRLLEALFYAAFGFVLSRSTLLPRWVARSAYALTVINLAFVPSVFFGNAPSDFYAANGWGTTATVGGLTMIWILAVGITLARAPK